MADNFLITYSGNDYSVLVQAEVLAAQKAAPPAAPQADVLQAKPTLPVPARPPAVLGPPAPSVAAGLPPIAPWLRPAVPAKAPKAKFATATPAATAALLALQKARPAAPPAAPAEPAEPPSWVGGVGPS